MTNTPRREMTMSIEIYRANYRALIAEAVHAGVVADAANFNDRALLAIGKDTIAAAREGNEDAICAVCDVAEIWLDSALAPSEPYRDEEPPNAFAR
jgi:hypothetical protein